MEQALRVVAWNLLEGECRRDGPTPLPDCDPERMEAARRLLRELAPDVVILNEALWGDDTGPYRRDYAALLGFPHGAAHAYDGPWGNAIVSQWPIVATRTFGIYNRGGLVATVDTPRGRLQVGTYHPHPSRYPQHKADDFQRLVDLFDLAIPGIIAGDFNAISPEDRIDVARLANGFSRFSARPLEDCLRFVEGGQSVFPLLATAGWTDTVREADRGATMPTRMLGEGGDSCMRIDHAWANPRLSSAVGQVIRHPLADVASDHYPVLVEAAWEP